MDSYGYEISYITIPALGHDFSDNAKVCRNEGCDAVNPDYVESKKEKSSESTESTEQSASETETPDVISQPTTVEEVPITGDVSNWMVLVVIMIGAMGVSVLSTRRIRIQ